MTARVLIVALGNALAGDDGAGPAVALALARRGLPAGARLESGETDSLRIASMWRGEAEVWIVDAFVAGAAPGTIHRLAHDELLALPQRHRSVHRLSLPENLRWIALAYPEMSRARYRLYGIEPRTIATKAGLSPEVAAAAEEVARMIARDYDFKCSGFSGIKSAVTNRPSLRISSPSK